MTTSIDLETRLASDEEAAFRSRFDDGIGDLLIGLVVLAMGFTVGTDSAGMVGVWSAMVIPLWFPLHKAVSNPRLGYVEFGPGRRAKVRRKKILLSLGLGVAMLGGIALYMLRINGEGAGAAGESVRPWAGLPFFGALALLLTVVGAMLKLRRAYLYAGFLMGFGFLTRDAVGIDPLGLSLMLSGGCITLSGLWLLVRFLMTHPRLENPGIDSRA
jgi:hypothetical protein